MFGALIVAIVIPDSPGSSSDGDNDATSAQASPDCLSAWNSDVYALNYGVHNSISHGYTDVQVGYMPKSGSALLSDDPGIGPCAAVFAANQPDPERQAAGQIRRGDEWIPLSRLLGLRDLVQLQVTAVTRANAKVTQYGKFVEGGSSALPGFVHRERVRFGDLDAMRHVNNAVFLRYFETARISYLRGLGIHDPVAEVDAGFGLIFAECHISYRSPVQFDEDLDVALTICDIRRSSFRGPSRCASASDSAPRATASWWDSTTLNSGRQR